MKSSFASLSFASIKATTLFVTASLVLLASNSFSDSNKFLKRGYVQNDRGDKCWYNQTIDNDSYYFHVSIAGTRGIMTFEDPNCMSEADGLGLEMNMMMINNVISRWYSHSDARFQTKANQLYNGSQLQQKGKCIQSATYPIIGITVDYEIEGGSITKVHHGASIMGCTK